VRARAQNPRFRLAAAAALLAAAAALLPAPGTARAEAPWQQAEQVRNGLFDAQTDILLEGGATAAEEVRRTQAAVSGKLAVQLRSSSPRSLAQLRAALADAEAAAAAGDEVALAAARGRAIAALRHGAFDVAVAAAAAGEADRARSWMLIRDFRQATRFTRPGVDATVALDAFEAGEASAQDAVTGIRKDLLDAYQARLVGYVNEASEAQERRFDAALAENAALAAGYWGIVADEYEAQRNPNARAKADSEFAAMAVAAERGDAREFARWRDAALNDLSGFTAAPFTPEEQARRATQLTRFLDLVPIEYDHGTDDGHVTIPFEIQESIAFMEGARSAFSDLQSELQERDPEGVQTVLAAFDELDRINADANEGRDVAPLEDVEELHDTASDALEGMMPDEWKESDTEADFDLIEISLDQMEAAVNAGEREQAEQARLSAYAFFEFGPERLLNSLDPQLVATVEGYVWYGAEGKEGLAELIASDGSGRDIRETRLALDEELEHARQVSGEGAEGLTVITNAALIVFREGLEAILIIAAITASMIGANRRLRKPILRGALLALPASALLFVFSVLVLDQLSEYGEKLEAIVGLVAIAVLLLVLNWFFHRVYWTEWIAGHRKRGKALAGAAGTGAVTAGATVAGLYVLGFTSVFREGFETVLFLQALQLESGIGIVLAGVSLGLVFTAAVGALTFALERKLPYKKMLIVTGVLISAVLVVLVGNTMRTLQGVGWVSITPIDIDLPLWMGTWLGIFPTWETIGAQIGAVVFVIGSYFLAEFVRKRNMRKAVAAAAEAEAQSAADLEPAYAKAGGNGNGAGNGRGKLAEGAPPRRLELERERERR
jgi:high-affinity iron transporter